MGLTSDVQIATLNVLNRAQNDDSELLIRRLEEAALTLLKNTDEEIPVAELKNQKIAVLTLGNSDSEVFVNQLKRYAKVHTFDTIMDEASDFDRLIISIHK